ncbi:MAG: hypothetical protein ABI867_17700 [Kofleriaceae bacterium]
MSRAVAIVALTWAVPAHGDDAVERRGSGEAAGTELDLRLTLSSFLYRQSGDAAAPFVGDGAPVDSASPVRRYFSDLRLEIADTGITFDGRIRQTTSERYQSGAGSGGEYEIRTLSGRIGSTRTALVLGRQVVDAVGSTKIDGATLIQRLTSTWSASLFGGAYPALGSRSLETDYPAIRKADGAEGSPLAPLTGGLGIGYNTPDLHGDVGLAAVYVAQDVPEATSTEGTRVFATATGYARPAPWLDLYHFAILDVAGSSAGTLTNGSLGINAHASSAVQVSASIHHVSAELFQIAARNALADPDPDSIGIVQNDIAVIRVSQDVARAGASVALVRSRFEISASGGYHRRPGVAVALADGGTLAFPEAKYADATLTVLDRKSIGGLRASASASLTMPLGGDSPNRSRGAIVRVMVGRAFHDSRAELTADVMAERFRATSSDGMCSDSLDLFRCFSASTTEAAQAGVLGSYRVAREWLVLLDAHAGLQKLDSVTLMGPVTFPRVFSLTMFARVQWRYR